MSLALVLRWSVRVVAALVVFGALAAGLFVVWGAGPVWWAVLWSPVFGFLALGAVVWMTENL